jgi:molecular chaperone DnaK
METEINLPYVTADSNGPKHLVVKLTRSKFEQLSSVLVKRLRAPVENALKDAGLSAKDFNEIILVGGATRMPMVQELVKDLTGKEGNKSVNPDEVVSVGAAIQAGVLAGEVQDVLLLDVTPLSLGVETLGGVMTTLIPRNTTVPVKKSEIFSTAEDNQTSVDVHVLQGERQMAVDNMSLGRFRLEGIPPAQRGLPQIEVTFDIDANGILNATAVDKATGKSQQITITASTNLKKEEVERLVEEAKKHEQQDSERRAVIDARNQADSAIYQVEKTLKEQNIASTPDLESKIQALRNAMEGSDRAAIQNLTNELQQIYTALVQQSAQQNEQTADRPDRDGEDVVEGEFTEA